MRLKPWSAGRDGDRDGALRSKWDQEGRDMMRTTEQPSRVRIGSSRTDKKDDCRGQRDALRIERWSRGLQPCEIILLFALIDRLK